MTDYSGLVEALRNSTRRTDEDCDEAAAAIEAQKRQLIEAQALNDHHLRNIVALRVQLDEARAERNKYDDAHKREARNVLRLTAELAEARAALEQEHKHMEAQTEIALRVITERDAMRAAVEKHNAKFTTTESDRIPLPPSSAPAAQPATPYGEMGQFVTPHGGGQVAAPAASEPFHAPHITDDGQIVRTVRDVFFAQPGAGFTGVPLSHGVAINSGAEAGAMSNPIEAAARHLCAIRGLSAEELVQVPHPTNPGYAVNCKAKQWTVLAKEIKAHLEIDRVLMYRLVEQQKTAPPQWWCPYCRELVPESALLAGTHNVPECGMEVVPMDRAAPSPAQPEGTK